MSAEDRVCPFCMKPIINSGLKYYVRKRDRDSWQESGPLYRMFSREIKSCGENNLYKQFWLERLAEKKIDLQEMEDRLVVTKQDLQSLMERKAGTVRPQTSLVRPDEQAGAGLVSDGRTASGLVNANRGKSRSGAVKKSDAQFETEEAKVRVELDENGINYKIYQDNKLAADTKIVCNHCWNVLPLQILQSDIRVIYIGLVAGIGVGKSCLFLSWLRSIDDKDAGLNNWPDRYQFESLMSYDMSYPKVYEEMMTNFEERDVCPKKTDPTFVPPAFFEATRVTDDTKVLLCIYDAAGEVLIRYKEKDQIDTLMKHLKATDAIVYLVDPEDVGMPTTNAYSKYPELKMKLQEDSSPLFGKEIPDPEMQSEAEAGRVAPRQLWEIMMAGLSAGSSIGRESKKTKNDDKAAKALRNYMQREKIKVIGDDQGIETITYKDTKKRILALAMSKSDSFNTEAVEEYPDLLQTSEGMTDDERTHYESMRREIVSDFFSQFYNLHKFNDYFEAHREFVLSALGCEARPDMLGQETILAGEYKPFRIEEPIHWILDTLLE